MLSASVKITPACISLVFRLAVKFEVNKLWSENASSNVRSLIVKAVQLSNIQIFEAGKSLGKNRNVSKLQFLFKVSSIVGP